LCAASSEAAASLASMCPASLEAAHMIDQKIFTQDPFSQIDIEGVGKLITMAIEKGKSVNPGLTAGVASLVANTLLN